MLQGQDPTSQFCKKMKTFGGSGFIKEAQPNVGPPSGSPTPTHTLANSQLILSARLTTAIVMQKVAAE